MKYPPEKYQSLNYQVDLLVQQSHPVKDYHFFCLQFNPALTIRRILSKIFFVQFVSICLLCSSIYDCMCLLHTSKLILCYFRRLRLLSSDYEEYFRNLTNQSSPVRLRPSAKENKLVVFFNWPIIVCVLLECLFLSVAMDCNLVPMD